MTELIGKQAEIFYNRRLIIGKIVDETKNMLHIKTNDRVLRIIKKNCKIRVEGRVIEGINLTKRPEDRIKV